MADRGTGSPSSSAHMGVRREISYAVRFQCVIKSNQGQNRDLREPYRLGNQTLQTEKRHKIRKSLVFFMILLQKHHLSVYTICRYRIYRLRNDHVEV